MIRVSGRRRYLVRGSPVGSLAGGVLGCLLGKFDYIHQFHNDAESQQDRKKDETNENCDPRLCEFVIVLLLDVSIYARNQMSSSFPVSRHR